MNDEQRLVCTKRAAAILNVSPAFLERDRCYGGANPEIPYVRVGKRSIRYEISVLRQYSTSRTVGALTPHDVRRADLNRPVAEGECHEDR